MTQNWGPPTYPPRPPQYQPPQYQQLPDPEPEYYDDESPPRSPLFYGLMGGCATLILVGCCVILLAVAWVVDARYGITSPKNVVATEATTFAETMPVQPANPAGEQPAPVNEQPQPVQSTSVPAGAGFPVLGDAVVADDIGIELVALDIQRGVQPVNLAPADGMEFVAVSVQLRRVAPASMPQLYEISNFQLQNGQDVLYQPDPQADNGRRLSGGELTDDTPVEGDLLFHVIAGDAPLKLLWQPVAGGTVYTVALQ